mmetsp:Transcript_33888/g.86640  ORF Transcript_33888/g.86640 Transcript_33888/m.86640 type:complete len:208 (+) Transcript_33888:424-1047(+)
MASFPSSACPSHALQQEHHNDILLNDASSPQSSKGICPGLCSDIQAIEASWHESPPARSKAACRRSVELGLHLIKGSKALVDLGLQRIARAVGAAGGSHALPEEGVVPVPPSVVADHGIEVRGHHRGGGAQLLQALALDLLALLDRTVDVVHVSLVVLGVVDVHRRRVNVRLQRVVAVCEGGQRERHGVAWCAGVNQQGCGGRNACE